MKSDAVFLGGDETGDAEFDEAVGVAGPGPELQIMHVDEEDIKPGI
jgi:hypothetical protein